MTNITPKPNDSADNMERYKKTVSNMEAAEDAMNFAEGKELKSIKEKNDRRRISLEALEDELEAENKSRITGYF